MIVFQITKQEEQQTPVKGLLQKIRPIIEGFSNAIPQHFEQSQKKGRP